MTTVLHVAGWAVGALALLAAWVMYEGPVIALMLSTAVFCQ